ncbi:tryptophan synthase beta subunit-like PLP-dependent enzyme [Polychaeton citri CBS 116435]|uniref:L-serine ammonia-lyase n=1 Tax=Polychaeton citri CBS 116435 TaxID=1314669 RepID=A0A9P4QIK9_9PEZI|nr:tryptophan synthase beta subunit-like PLP-dependent enzyme [Polychaeton citri CBS 116435]
MAIKTRTERRPWRETPLVESCNLTKAAGCRIFLKLENLQPSGSFKSRGIGNFCQQTLNRSEHPDKVHFYSSSGGNAGLACVHAANTLGRPSTVVVPTSTKPHMVDKIKAAGASEVIQTGAHWSEADAYLREQLMARAEASGEQPVYVHPFNHDDTFAGHSTMIDEISKQLAAQGEDAPDAVVCSVGGGGLLTGVSQGVERQGEGWAKTQIVAVETEGANALAASLEAGELVTLPGITSLATSLGAVRVVDHAFQVADKGSETGRVSSVVLSDAEAAMGCWRLADEERILVELACGVSVALCFGSRLEKALGRPVRPDDKVVMVVCGGSNISTDMMEAYKAQFGDVEA